jgi:uncharacterized protein involved in exopolysaccharide biosynthesis
MPLTAETSPASDRDLPGTDYTFARLLLTLVRHARLVVQLAVVCALAASLGVLLRPRSYASISSFVPSTRNGSIGGLSGIAAQLGVNVPGADASESAPFYADLITSEEILSSLADTRVGIGHDSVPLALVLHVSDTDPAARRFATVEELRHRVTAVASARTGTVQVTVTMRDPGAARQVNARILELVDRFNVERRRSRASAERKFSEQRLGEVRAELQVAENRLENFLQRNRMLTDPELLLQQQRLAREVTFRQQLVTVLAQAYEQARLDEIRDTPLLTVVQRPTLPVRPEPRRLVYLALGALVGGAALGLLSGVAYDGWRAASLDGDGRYSALKEALRGSNRPWYRS